MPAFLFHEGALHLLHRDGRIKCGRIWTAGDESVSVRKALGPVFKRFDQAASELIDSLFTGIISEKIREFMGILGKIEILLAAAFAMPYVFVLLGYNPVV